MELIINILSVIVAIGALISVFYFYHTFIDEPKNKNKNTRHENIQNKEEQQ